MKEFLNFDFNLIGRQSKPSLEKLQGRSLLLTGGTGFFGKWILGFLDYANSHCDLNLKIHVLSRNPSSFLTDFPDFQARGIQFITGDIREFKWTKKTDYVIHAATDASASLNQEQPSQMFDVIVNGTKNLLENCKQSKPEKILIVSSGAVYGKQESQQIHQPDETLTAPETHLSSSAYGEGKRVSELMGTFHFKETGQLVSFARCFSFVGPYLPLDRHFAVGNFINDCLSGRDILITGDGTPCRSYMYPTDLVTWLLKILTFGENLRSYNVGSEESVNIAALAQSVSEAWFELSGQLIQPRLLVKPKNDASISRYVPETERAKKELGLSLQIPLREALLRTFKWHASQRKIPLIKTD
ncbi:MAG: NAD-dependent epimerase/dehydratase family protein [Bdellovibrionia bacterium]